MSLLGNAAVNSTIIRSDKHHIILTTFRTRCAKSTARDAVSRVADRQHVLRSGAGSACYRTCVCQLRSGTARREQAGQASLPVDPLTPNDHYSGRTAPLTSKRCILHIYSTNIGTEYLKNGIYSPFFFSSKCSLFHNSNVFGSCIIHILYTGCAKIN